MGVPHTVWHRVLPRVGASLVQADYVPQGMWDEDLGRHRAMCEAR